MSSSTYAIVSAISLALFFIIRSVARGKVKEIINVKRMLIITAFAGVVTVVTFVILDYPLISILCEIGVGILSGIIAALAEEYHSRNKQK